MRIGRWVFGSVKPGAHELSTCPVKLCMLLSVVGQFNGLVTLPRIADVYEALGRFLRDLNMLNDVSQHQ